MALQLPPIVRLLAEQMAAPPRSRAPHGRSFGPPAAGGQSVVVPVPRKQRTAAPPRKQRPLRPSRPGGRGRLPLPAVPSLTRLPVPPPLSPTPRLPLQPPAPHPLEQAVGVFGAAPGLSSLQEQIINEADRRQQEEVARQIVAAELARLGLLPKPPVKQGLGVLGRGGAIGGGISFE